MVELAEGIVIACVAATFFSDIMSRTIKMIRARRAPKQVHVSPEDAQPAH